MASTPRRPGDLTHEMHRAILSLAGLRQLVQDNISATGGANTAYTVADGRTRRVICIHLDATDGDIRFNYNAAATATSIPVIGSQYFIVDAQKDDTLNFWNATGSAITVYFLEIE